MMRMMLMIRGGRRGRSRYAAIVWRVDDVFTVIKGRVLIRARVGRWRRRTSAARVTAVDARTVRRSTSNRLAAQSFAQFVVWLVVMMLLRSGSRRTLTWIVSSFGGGGRRRVIWRYRRTESRRNWMSARITAAHATARTRKSLAAAVSPTTIVAGERRRYRA